MILSSQQTKVWKQRLVVAANAVLTCGGATAAELAIVNAIVFDATGAQPYGATVVINDGRITAVERSGEYPDGTPVLDAQGLSLLPGFYDLHVHYTPRGEPGTTPQISHAYLASGVTSVFDFHRPPEALAPLREWLTQFPGPRVSFAARMSTTNGHGADWSDTTTTRWVNTPFAATRAVQELLPYRPDVIKVFTDGWRYGSGIDNTSMNEPTLKALVDEAHAHELKVLTHTVTAERAGIAGRAGVDVIAHSILDAPLDETTIADLRKGGTAYAATLAVYEADKPGRETLEPKELEMRRARARIGLNNVKALHDRGVLIALGTDAGMPLTPHGVSTLREMELLVRAGLDPEEALMAGTANSARAVGELDHRGTIEPGKVADIVLIDGKPWDDIHQVRNVVYTFVGGKLVFGEGAPSPVMVTTMPAARINLAIIDDFERDDGRTARDTLRAGDPDGGSERSWQIHQTLPEQGRGRILHLAALLAMRDDARAGLILPLNRGGIQPADARAFDGIRFDVRGDAGPYLISVTTTAGSWTAQAPAGGDWETIEVPFDSLEPPAEGVAWTGEDLLDVRFLVERPGGEKVWMELDDVTFYSLDR